MGRLDPKRSALIIEEVCERPPELDTRKPARLVDIVCAPLLVDHGSESGASQFQTRLRDFMISYPELRLSVVGSWCYSTGETYPYGSMCSVDEPYGRSRSYQPNADGSPRIGFASLSTAKLLLLATTSNPSLYGEQIPEAWTPAAHTVRVAVASGAEELFQQFLQIELELNERRAPALREHYATKR